MERSELIDVLKGSAITLVVLGHSIQYGYGLDYFEKDSFYDNYVFRAIYTFHMPLFMLISGYLFVRSNRKELVHVICNKVNYIGVPYLFYYSLLYFLWWYSSQLDAFYFSDYLMKLQGQVWLWFLSSLMLNCFLISFSSHLLGNYVSIWLSMILVLFFFLVPNTILPDTHKYMFTFFSIGYYCERNIQQFVIKLKKIRIWFCLLFLFLLSLFFYDKDLMIYKGGYCIIDNSHIITQQLNKDIVRYLVGLVATCCFVGFVEIFVMRVRFFCNFLCILGQHTLAIYCMQSVFFVFISIYMDKIYFLHENMFFMWPFVLCCLVLMLCEILIFCFKRNIVTKRLFLGK